MYIHLHVLLYIYPYIIQDFSHHPQLMYISGHFRMDGTDPRVVAVVRPVSPPSILEIRMEGNMFVTHYQLDMRCSFFDGR